MTAAARRTPSATWLRPTGRLVPHMADGASPLQLAASLARYSKHPLAAAVMRAAASDHLPRLDASEVSEKPGQELEGVVTGRHVRILGRRRAETLGLAPFLPPPASGLECIVIVDSADAATFRFHDGAREDSRSFIGHLGPRHQVDRDPARRPESRHPVHSQGGDYARRAGARRHAVPRRRDQRRPGARRRDGRHRLRPRERDYD